MAKFSESVKDCLNRIESDKRSLRAMRDAARLLSGINLDDVSYIQAWRNTYDDRNKLRISLELKEDRKDSKLAHKIVRKLGGEFAKRKHYDESSIDMEMDTTNFCISISNVVPASCKLVQVEETLTDEEYAKEVEYAMSNVKRTRVKTRIQCTDAATDLVTQ